MIRPNTRPLVLAFVLGASACSGSGSSTSPDGGAVNPAALTYWGDIAPLLNDKCVKCHQKGGIGPIALDNFDDVKKFSGDVTVNTKLKIMPPYLVTHDGTCGDFQDGEALSPEQIGKIDGWVKGGMKEGTKAAVTPAKIPSLE